MAGETFRERKAGRTRAQLASAAMELFLERGFDAVTVAQIAERAWVSERTVYRYFGSKEDVLWGDSADQLSRLAIAIERRPPMEPTLDVIRGAMLELADEVDIDPALVVMRARLVAATPALVGRDLRESLQWEAAVADALRRRAGRVGDEVGEGAGDFAVSIAAAAASAALRVAFQRWVDRGATGGVKTVIVDAFDALGAVL